MSSGIVFLLRKPNCMHKVGSSAPSWCCVQRMCSGPGMLLLNWMPICQWQAGLRTCRNAVYRLVRVCDRPTVTILRQARQGLSGVSRFRTGSLWSAILQVVGFIVLFKIVADATLFRLLRLCAGAKEPVVVCRQRACISQRRAQELAAVRFPTGRQGGCARPYFNFQGLHIFRQMQVLRRHWAHDCGYLGSSWLKFVAVPCLCPPLHCQGNYIELIMERQLHVTSICLGSSIPSGLGFDLYWDHVRMSSQTDSKVSRRSSHSCPLY